MDDVDRTKMKYLAAYLLLTAAGNTTPSSEDIKSVLSSVGIETNDKDVASLLSAVEGKDINEVNLSSDI
jgi:large subunit ribosomal protein LP2